MVQTPHFFSLVLDDSVQDMLIIPTSFLRVYGNHLSRKAFLKVPYGENWKIDVVRIGNNVWFGNGWKPFADFYSISYGSFLMFGFEDFQNSTFSVLIFDKSASEIDYPFHLQEEEEDNDQEQPNVEELVDSPMDEIISDMDVFSISSEDESQRPSTSRPRKENKKNRTQSEEKIDNGELWTAGRKANAVKIAKSLYKSENPSFYIVMQPSQVVSTKLVVPANFANKYFTKQQQGIISVKSVNGKTWSFKYCSYQNHQEKHRYTIISTGWTKFVKDNDLAIGDVCVFELLNPNATELKVVICRENQIAAIGNSKHSKHEDMSSLKDFTSVNPYFTVKLQKSYLEHNFINVPTKFMEKCKNRSMEKAGLQVEKEEWPVKLLNAPSDNRFKLSAGFSRFVNENSLKVGDVCVFELINSEAMLLKVSIFRNH